MLNEVRADIFEFNQHEYNFRYICITTNCELNSSNQAIMGRGIALRAKELFPELPSMVAEAIKRHRSHVVKMLPSIKNTAHPVGFINFPTKTKWAEKSKISLIIQNMIELSALARNDDSSLYTLPRPGCNNGGLNWEKEIKPLAEKFLNLKNIMVVDLNV